jgi:Fe-S oxidoreductase/FAD/FMN-containing dehydrogenase
MSSLSKRQQQELTELFGERATFDKTERKLYGHDVAAMPSMVKPVIGDTTPDAVVQPKSEEQLAALMKWASAARVALTPRGKASSGYGGVIPVKNGVVVDFSFMKDVLAVDSDAQTVTVQPGITWEQLDRALKPHGLTLRLYPTSYPSSTVGGWLSQGGAGIGSYRYGYFADNVVSAKAVLPSGEARVFEGNDLALLAGAEGITGFLSEVTVRVMPIWEPHVLSLSCAKARCLQRVVEEIEAADLPIWSMCFINPRMAQLKNEAPVRMHNGHPVEKHVELPNSYILTLCCDVKDAVTVEAGIARILAANEATRLSDEIAQHEYEHRFKFMVVKRLGPSLVPSEVVVPLRNLGDAMAAIETVVEQPIVKEGVIVRHGPSGESEAVILGFIPADERKLNYNLVFGLVLSVIKVAEAHGGRAYSTGMYFGGKADTILGADNVRRIRAFKQEVDPSGILNPRKVLDNGVTGTLLEFASKFESQIRALGNRVTIEVGERPGDPVRGIPGDVAWYAYSCSQCGYCVDQCDQFYGRGWESQSPRGKWYWLREYMAGREEWNQKMVDTFLVCTTCELCNVRCSASLPIEPSWMKLRGKLIQDDKWMTFPPFEMMSAALASQGDIWAGYRKDRDAWFPEDLKEKHGPGVQAPNVYFAGCTASFVENDIGIASVRILDEAGVDFTYLGTKELCCATPMLVAGKWEQFLDVMRANIANVKASGADTVITSCPACDMMWRQTYPAWAEKHGIDFGISVKHYSEVIAEKIAAGEFAFPEKVEADAAKGRRARVNGQQKAKVTWHDSCHIGRVSGIYEPPRDLIKANPNADFVELPFNREEAHCCGSVLTLIKEPTVAAGIGSVKHEEARSVGAEKLLALCPCCEFQLRVAGEASNSDVEVVDLARFTAEALGYDLPDPNPEVAAQWAVFEAMINLMTPEGFAEIMRGMFPELVEAMPMGMGGMMKGMAKVPGALEGMKPMFPVLFPKLLPAMMPKVMPKMLELVAAKVPLPDYMAEQMPDLMPRVMDALMPHMIGDVVPLVADDLVAYLKSVANGNGGGRGAQAGAQETVARK